MEGSMSAPKVRIGDRWVGKGESVFVIAEIGINHNGSLDLAKKLIDGAVLSGCDAVKFQKRTPELCVPRDQWNVQRETPWGRMTYIDYRRKIEFGEAEYRIIHDYCAQKGIIWFASPWDEESVDFLAKFEPPVYKVASASVTDTDLLAKLRGTGRPVILSTGMSTMDEVDAAVAALGTDHLLVAHAVSSYPCPVTDLNLKMIPVLAALRTAGVSLVSAWGFSTWGGQGEVFLVPEDAAAFLSAAAKAGLSAKETICFHVSDENRVGAVAELLEKIAAAEINLSGADAVAVGDQFGMVLWSHEPDKLGAALGI
jgi:hypothetical protein